jgi:histone-lysine N-methyltransferase SUV39H
VCSCGPNCSNRVVQNGSELPLQIFRSPVLDLAFFALVLALLCSSCVQDKGWAVRALSDVRRGQFVCEYLGELITSEEADRRGYQLAHPETSYLYELDFAHGQEDSENQEAAYVLDATEMGGVARFLNHSCDPNLASYSVWVDDLDPGRPRIAFFALRDIRANEELHFNYQMVGALSRDIPCYCGARNCRKFLS